MTYNVNGLRPRIQQYGSLLKLLDSLDADIICFQETKLSRYDLRADLVRAEGYESFFSCTRTSDRGRSAGYSGVATFCRVKSAFLSNEVALPISAEEGFTGLLATSKGYEPRKKECPSIAEGLECFSRDELLKVDSEGRCLITDHGHFVLFNIYGPRAVQDDSDRVQFKLTFFKMLERRWEGLLHKGRRIIIVGDLNIAPAAIDRCDAEPDFEKNGFRRWFRSLLVQNGGRLLDIFRAKHPDRKGAYTCWSQSSGAEEFNFGSRIDHILSAGSCLHGEEIQEGHDFVTCHVAECDILMQFQRWKPGNTPRWKGGRSIKLEGSDHVPVYTSLVEIPEVLQHSTPSLSTRYHPQVFGSQQTLVQCQCSREGKQLSKLFRRKVKALRCQVRKNLSQLQRNMIVKLLRLRCLILKVMLIVCPALRPRRKQGMVRGLSSHLTHSSKNAHIEVRLLAAAFLILNFVRQTSLILRLSPKEFLLLLMNVALQRTADQMQSTIINMSAS